MTAAAAYTETDPPCGSTGPGAGLIATIALLRWAYIIIFLTLGRYIPEGV